MDSSTSYSSENLLKSKSSLKTKKHIKIEDDKLAEEDELNVQCIEFEGVETVAKNFLDDLLDKTVQTVSQYRITENEEDVSEESDESAITFVEFFGSFTSWPTIAEFTVELGEDRLKEYLSTWRYDEDWLYCIDLILEQSDDCCDYYIYETKWSLPTNAYPIPQATASIFFTIALSRVKSPHCLVDVTYIFEGCQYVHVPFKHPFCEQWLFNIIEAKLKFFQTLKF